MIMSSTSSDQVFENANNGSSTNNNMIKGTVGSALIDLEIIDCTFYTDNSIKQIKIGFIAAVPAFGFRII